MKDFNASSITKADKEGREAAIAAFGGGSFDPEAVSNLSVPSNPVDRFFFAWSASATLGEILLRYGDKGIMDNAENIADFIVGLSSPDFPETIFQFANVIGLAGYESNGTGDKAAKSFDYDLSGHKTFDDENESIGQFENKNKFISALTKRLLDKGEHALGLVASLIPPISHGICNTGVGTLFFTDAAALNTGTNASSHHAVNAFARTFSDRTAERIGEMKDRLSGTRFFRQFDSANEEVLAQGFFAALRSEKKSVAVIIGSSPSFPQDCIAGKGKYYAARGTPPEVISSIHELILMKTGNASDKTPAPKK